MNIENLKAVSSDTHNKAGHSHAGHMKMMILCLGLPVLGLVILYMLNISIPSLELILLLLCPILMGSMMWMMMREDSNNEKSSHVLSDETLDTVFPESQSSKSLTKIDINDQHRGEI